MRIKAPQSISTSLTALSVLAGLLAGAMLVFLFFPTLPAAESSFIVIFCLALPGAMVEVLVNRAPWASGLDPHRRSASLNRVLKKTTALWSIVFVIIYCYNVMPYYEQDVFIPLHYSIRHYLVPFLLMSVPYIALVDMLQREPEDALHALGNRIWTFSFALSPSEVNYLLGWLVKGFFLPLMFCWLTSQIQGFRGFDYSVFSSSNYITVVDGFYDLALYLIFFADLALAAAGYMLTLKLLGTEIRTVEPTFLGWFVAIFCYPPFNESLNNTIFIYGHQQPWDVLFANSPVLYTIWATAIVALFSVFVWTTAYFGIRFSNLTNRGIITTGPFRWTKHPAYIAKNISWWLMSLPFLPADGSVWTAVHLSIGMILMNLMYYLRAKTEERHLSQDPVYREYAAYIREHGIFRWLSWRPGRLAGSMPRGTPDVI